MVVSDLELVEPKFKIMRYIVVYKGVDNSIKSKPRKFTAYFKEKMFGINSFSFNKAEAKVFRTKREANSISKLKSSYETVKTD